MQRSVRLLSTFVSLVVCEHLGGLLFVEKGEAQQLSGKLRHG